MLKCRIEGEGVGDDSLSPPHFQVIFDSAPPPYLKGLNKQRSQLPEGPVIVASTGMLLLNASVT